MSPCSGHKNIWSQWRYRSTFFTRYRMVWSVSRPGVFTSKELGPCSHQYKPVWMVWRRNKSLSFAGNWTTISRSRSPCPSHYIDWNTVDHLPACLTWILRHYAKQEYVNNRSTVRNRWLWQKGREKKNLLLYRCVRCRVKIAEIARNRDFDVRY